MREFTLKIVFMLVFTDCKPNLPYKKQGLLLNSIPAILVLSIKIKQMAFIDVKLTPFLFFSKILILGK